MMMMMMMMKKKRRNRADGDEEVKRRREEKKNFHFLPHRLNTHLPFYQLHLLLTTNALSSFHSFSFLDRVPSFLTAGFFPVFFFLPEAEAEAEAGNRNGRSKRLHL